MPDLSANAPRNTATCPYAAPSNLVHRRTFRLAAASSGPKLSRDVLHYRAGAGDPRGGDRGLPVALAGPKSPPAAAFYEIARKLMDRAESAAAASTDVIEISQEWFGRYRSQFAQVGFGV